MSLTTHEKRSIAKSFETFGQFLVAEQTVEQLRFYVDAGTTKLLLKDPVTILRCEIGFRNGGEYYSSVYRYIKDHTEIDDNLGALLLCLFNHYYQQAKT